MITCGHSNPKTVLPKCSRYFKTKIYLVGAYSEFCSDNTSLKCDLIPKKVNKSSEMAKNANRDFEQMRQQKNKYSCLH